MNVGELRLFGLFKLLKFFDSDKLVIDLEDDVLVIFISKFLSREHANRLHQEARAATSESWVQVGSPSKANG